MKNFRKLLDDNMYSLLVRQAFGGFDNDFSFLACEEAVKVNISDFDEKQKMLIIFFLTGKGILKDDFVTLFSKEVLDELNSRNIVLDDGIFVILKDIVLSFWRGYYIFVSKRNMKNDCSSTFFKITNHYLATLLLRKKMDVALFIDFGIGVEPLIMSGAYKRLIIEVDTIEDLIVGKLNLELNAISNVEYSLVIDNRTIEKNYDLVVLGPTKINLNVRRNINSFVDMLVEGGEMFLLYEFDCDFGQELSGIFEKTINVVGFICDVFIVNERPFLIEGILRKIISCIIHIKKDAFDISSAAKIIYLCPSLFLNLEYYVNVKTDKLNIIKNPDTYSLIYGKTLLASIDQEAKLYIENLEANLLEKMDSGTDIKIIQTLFQLEKMNIIRRRKK